MVDLVGLQNTFGMISMNQTIEETINKDTQTAGGAKGFSTKQKAIPKNIITADDRTSFVREMRTMVNVKNKGFWH